MPAVENHSRTTLLLFTLAMALGSGCDSRSDRKLPVAARKAKNATAAAAIKQPTTPVARKAVNPSVAEKPRITRQAALPNSGSRGVGSNVTATKRNPGASDLESTGILTGRVLLSGKPPAARKITVTKDQDICGLASGEVRDVIVSAENGIQNVVVEIIGIEPNDDGFSWNHPEGGYVLRQKGCQFKPALLVMPSGEELTVRNDDSVGHNVNSGQWNEQQPGGGTPIVRPLSGTRPVRIGCNIHSWMEAWVYLARSPYYALTDADGNYRINDVPPGTYRVTYWHPSLRPARQRVTFKAGELHQCDVTIKSPVRN